MNGKIEAALRRARKSMPPLVATHEAHAEVRSMSGPKPIDWRYVDPDELREQAWAALEEAGLELAVTSWEVRAASEQGRLDLLEVHFRFVLFDGDDAVADDDFAVSMPLDASGSPSLRHAALAVLTAAETRVLLHRLRVRIINRKGSKPNNPHIKQRTTSSGPLPTHPNFDPGNLPPPDGWEPEPDDDLPEDFGAVADEDTDGDEEQAEPVTRADVADRWRALQAAGCSQPWAKFVEGAVGRPPPIVDEDLPKLAQAIDELLELAASQRAAAEAAQ